MSYRSERDESRLNDAEWLAWEHVLPYRYVPILDSDRDSARALAAFLSANFSRQALKAAAARIVPLTYAIKKQPPSPAASGEVREGRG